MTYQITKLLMIIAGAWQLEMGISKTWKTIYKIYTLILILPYHACPIMFLLKFYELYGVDNDKAVECLSMLVIVFLLIIKMALCQKKEMTKVLQSTIQKVNDALKNDNETVKSIYIHYTHYANRLNIFLTFWSFTVGLILTISAIFEDINYLKTHETTNGFPLQVLYWYPFPYHEHYKLVLAYQCFTVLFSDLYNSCLQSLPNTVMMQLTAEIKILQHNLENFTRDKITGKEVSREQAYFNLRELIIDHQNIIDHINKLNKALRMNLMLEYGVSSVILASILVQIISGKKVIFNCVYFGTVAFGWFMLCYNANEIQLQSTNMSMALYKSCWYEQDRRTNRLVFIFMMRTQKPLSVHIGPFGPLTIDAAISRFKLAYSYVSVMST